MAAILSVLWGWSALLRGKLTPGALGAIEVFWYFVVLIWPVLYWKVYL